MTKTNMLRTSLKTPVGTAIIIGDKNGVSEIKIIDETEENTSDIPGELMEAHDQLIDYFSGNLKNFDFKMNPEGTNFQQKVWRELQNIPFGTTTSYLQLSRKIGDVKAIRAVAAANGRNPLWIVTPCHRVIGSDGALTGYAGGIWRKKWLLDFENPPAQQELF